MAQPEKPLHADAARNRARVLEVAYDTFAAGGLSVPIDEIARRAGVVREACTGISRRKRICTGRSSRTGSTASWTGSRAGDHQGAGEALFTFLRSVVLQWGATDQGLADSLAGAGSTSRPRCRTPRRSFWD